MFGRRTDQAAEAAARERQFAAARQASAAELEEFLGQGMAEALGREAERYLAFVAIAREGGDEARLPRSMPEWLERAAAEAAHAEV